MSWYMLGDGRPSNTFRLIWRPARITSSRTSQWPSSLRALPWLPPNSLQPRRIPSRPSGMRQDQRRSGPKVRPSPARFARRRTSGQ
eukprot:9877731-Heterocapsa_arctica.AAC.1